MLYCGIRCKATGTVSQNNGRKTLTQATNKRSATIRCAFGDRLGVGRQVLALVTGVRIPVPEPKQVSPLVGSFVFLLTGLCPIFQCAIIVSCLKKSPPLNGARRPLQAFTRVSQRNLECFKKDTAKRCLGCLMNGKSVPLRNYAYLLPRHSLPS